MFLGARAFEDVAADCILDEGSSSGRSSESESSSRRAEGPGRSGRSKASVTSKMPSSSVDMG